MIKIRNKEINDEKIEVAIKTSIYNKIPVKVLDLWIRYEENNNKITHFFESVIEIEKIKKLSINQIIEKVGISDYLYVVDGKLDNSLEIDNDYIDSFKEIIVRIKKKSEKKLKLRIEIEKLQVECEEIIDLNVLEESGL